MEQQASGFIYLVERGFYPSENGDFHIDNNAIENKIRPVALGRKNYLFAGSHQGAKRTAMFYTFFACCKLNDVNPEKWLNSVL
jgi:transposase